MRGAQRRRALHCCRPWPRCRCGGPGDTRTHRRPDRPRGQRSQPWCGATTDAHTRRRNVRTDERTRRTLHPWPQYNPRIYTSTDISRCGLVAWRQLVTVRAEDEIKLDDFVIPANISFVTIPGVVRDSTGVPAVGARVFLAGPQEGDHIVGEPAITDESGQFVLSAPAGRQYRLFAERARPGSASSRVDVTDVINVTATFDRTVRKLTLRALH